MSPVAHSAAGSSPKISPSMAAFAAEIRRLPSYRSSSSSWSSYVIPSPLRSMKPDEEVARENSFNPVATEDMFVDSRQHSLQQPASSHHSVFTESIYSRSASDHAVAPGHTSTVELRTPSGITKSAQWLQRQSRLHHPVTNESLRARYEETLPTRYAGLTMNSLNGKPLISREEAQRRQRSQRAAEALQRAPKPLSRTECERPQSSSRPAIQVKPRTSSFDSFKHKLSGMVSPFKGKGNQRQTDSSPIPHISTPSRAPFSDATSAHTELKLTKSSTRGRTSESNHALSYRSYPQTGRPARSASPISKSVAELGALTKPAKPATCLIATRETTLPARSERREPLPAKTKTHKTPRSASAASKIPRQGDGDEASQEPNMLPRTISNSHPAVLIPSVNPALPTSPVPQLKGSAVPAPLQVRKVLGAQQVRRGSIESISTSSTGKHLSRAVDLGIDANGNLEAAAEEIDILLGRLKRPLSDPQDEDPEPQLTLDTYIHGGKVTFRSIEKTGADTAETATKTFDRQFIGLEAHRQQRRDQFQLTQQMLRTARK